MGWLLTQSQGWIRDIIDADILVPCLAILVGGIVGGTIVVTVLVMRHRERLAMIEKGMDPDRLDR